VLGYQALRPVIQINSNSRRKTGGFNFDCYYCTSYVFINMPECYIQFSEENLLAFKIWAWRFLLQKKVLIKMMNEKPQKAVNSVFYV
jgi:hypothetical protein